MWPKKPGKFWMKTFTQPEPFTAKTFIERPNQMTNDEIKKHVETLKAMRNCHSIRLRLLGVAPTSLQFAEEIAALNVAIKALENQSQQTNEPTEPMNTQQQIDTTNEEPINALISAIMGEQDYGKKHGYKKGLADALGRVRWIPVEERLPEDKGSGWQIIVRGVSHNDREFIQGDAWFEDGKFWEWDSYGTPEEIFGVTHWMPLPEGPK